MQKTFLLIVIASSFHLTANAQKLPRVIILATCGIIAGKVASADDGPKNLYNSILVTAAPQSKSKSILDWLGKYLKS